MIPGSYELWQDGKRVIQPPGPEHPAHPAHPEYEALIVAWRAFTARMDSLRRSRPSPSPASAIPLLAS